jgi:hypothetical protein
MAPLEGQPMSTPAPKKKLRYRLYFWLMDICLILSVLGLTEFILDYGLGIILIATDSPIYPIISLFFISANFIVPLFLVVARFMRDEFAELLWKKTATTLLYGFVVVPGFVLTTTYVASLFGSRIHVAILQALQEYTAIQAIVVGWMAVMLAFVGLFQFYRWRASW